MPTRKLKQGQTYWVPDLIGASGHLMITTYRITAVKGDTVWYSRSPVGHWGSHFNGWDSIENFLNYDLCLSYNTARKQGLYIQEIHRKTWEEVKAKLRGFKNKLVLYKVKD